MKHRLSDNDTWLVVHTPKTAGTSLRWALEKYFGKLKVIRDYGPRSPVTSDVVRRYLYSGDESKKLEDLVTKIKKEKKSILIGHFPLQKYTNFFEARKIITFVREPLVRMCSEYLHRRKNGTFTGTFLEFLQRPGYQNMQSRFLTDISEETFVGVTEKYNLSLQHINHISGWNLSTRKKNVGRRGGGGKFARNLSVRELDLFYKMNAEDVELYQFATQRFATLEASDI